MGMVRHCGRLVAAALLTLASAAFALAAEPAQGPRGNGTAWGRQAGNHGAMNMGGGFSGGMGGGSGMRGATGMMGGGAHGGGAMGGWGSLTGMLGNLLQGLGWGSPPDRPRDVPMGQGNWWNGWAPESGRQGRGPGMRATPGAPGR